MEKSTELNRIFKFSAPVVADVAVSHITTSLILSIFAGVSANSLAAYGTTTTVVDLISAFFIITSFAPPIIISRLKGTGKLSESTDVAGNSITICFITNCVVAAICMIFAAPLIRFLAPTDNAELLGESITFLKIYAISLPFYSVISLCAVFLRNVGKSFVVMIAIFVMNGSQLIAAWVLIKVFNGNIISIGITYIICRVLTALFLLILLFYYRDFKIRVASYFKIQPSLLKRMFRLGYPVMFSTIFSATVGVYINSIILKIGIEAASVNQIVRAINNITMVSTAWCSSYVTMVSSEFIGRNEIDKLKLYMRKFGLCVTGVVVLISLIFALFGKPLARFYSEDTLIIKYTVYLLWIMIASNIITTYNIIVSAVLTIGGDTKFSSMLSMLSFVIKIPIVLLFAYVLNYGIFSIFLTEICVALILALLYAIRYKGDKWLHIDV